MIESVKRSGRYKAGGFFVVIILLTKQFSDLHCFGQYNHCYFVGNDEDNGYFSFLNYWNIKGKFKNIGSGIVTYELTCTSMLLSFPLKKTTAKYSVWEIILTNWRQR